MNTIMAYPGFAKLPPNLKKFLVTTETFFYEETKPGADTRLEQINGTPIAPVYTFATSPNPQEELKYLS
jgi:hypothetical protein